MVREEHPSLILTTQYMWTPALIDRCMFVRKPVLTSPGIVACNTPLPFVVTHSATGISRCRVHSLLELDRAEHRILFTYIA